MTEQSIAEVAARLPEAQREAVLALYADDYKRWPTQRLKAMQDGLGHHGLAELATLGLAAKGPPWRLTPLGYHLRDHLISQGADHDR